MERKEHPIWEGSPTIQPAKTVVAKKTQPDSTPSYLYREECPALANPQPDLACSMETSVQPRKTVDAKKTQPIWEGLPTIPPAKTVVAKKTQPDSTPSYLYKEESPNETNPKQDFQRPRPLEKQEHPIWEGLPTTQPEKIVVAKKTQPDSPSYMYREKCPVLANPQHDSAHPELVERQEHPIWKQFPTFQPAKTVVAKKTQPDSTPSYLYREKCPVMANTRQDLARPMETSIQPAKTVVAKKTQPDSTYLYREELPNVTNTKQDFQRSRPMERKEHPIWEGLPTNPPAKTVVAKKMQPDSTPSYLYKEESPNVTNPQHGFPHPRPVETKEHPIWKGLPTPNTIVAIKTQPDGTVAYIYTDECPYMTIPQKDVARPGPMETSAQPRKTVDAKKTQPDSTLSFLYRKASPNETNPKQDYPRPRPVERQEHPIWKGLPTIQSPKTIVAIKTQPDGTVSYLYRDECPLMTIPQKEFVRPGPEEENAIWQGLPGNQPSKTVFAKKTQPDSMLSYLYRKKSTFMTDPQQHDFARPGPSGVQIGGKGSMKRNEKKPATVVSSKTAVQDQEITSKNEQQVKSKLIADYILREVKDVQKTFEERKRAIDKGFRKYKVLVRRSVRLANEECGKDNEECKETLQNTEEQKESLVVTGTRRTRNRRANRKKRLQEEKDEKQGPSQSNLLRLAARKFAEPERRMAVPKQCTTVQTVEEVERERSDSQVESVEDCIINKRLMEVGKIEKTERVAGRRRTRSKRVSKRLQLKKKKEEKIALLSALIKKIEDTRKQEKARISAEREQTDFVEADTEDASKRQTRSQSRKEQEQLNSRARPGRVGGKNVQPKKKPTCSCPGAIISDSDEEYVGVLADIDKEETGQVSSRRTMLQSINKNSRIQDVRDLEKLLLPSSSSAQKNVSPCINSQEYRRQDVVAKTNSNPPKNTNEEAKACLRFNNRDTEMISLGQQIGQLQLADRAEQGAQGMEAKTNRIGQKILYLKLVNETEEGEGVMRIAAVKELDDKEIMEIPQEQAAGLEYAIVSNGKSKQYVLVEVVNPDRDLNED